MSSALQGKKSETSMKIERKMGKYSLEFGIPVPKMLIVSGFSNLCSQRLQNPM